MAEAPICRPQQRVFDVATGKGTRPLIIWAAIIFGCLVVVITELENAFGLFKFVPVLVTWAVIASAACFALRKRRIGQMPYVDGITGLCVTGCFLASLIILVTAWVSPPNTIDVLAYHLPRVVYWMQNGSLGVFPSPYPQQNFMPPFAEYVDLQLALLKGSDRLANLVQVPAYLGLVCAISLIARELGAGPRGQALAAFTAATIPAAVLEASGANNDVILSFWLAAMTWFAVRYQRSPNNLDIIGASTAFALALLTKGTAFVLAPPLLLPALPIAWRKGRREMVRIAIIGATLTLLLNGPFQYRIAGHPGARFGITINSSLGVKTMASNALRVTATLMGTSNRTANLFLYRAVAAAHTAMRQDLNNPSTTFVGTPFSIPTASREEETAPDALHLVLVFLAVPCAIWLAIRRRATLLARNGAALCVAFLLFCAIFRYQPYHTRLLFSLLALSAALIGVIVERVLPVFLHVLLVLVLAWSAVPYLFENELRPLIGPANMFATDRDGNYFRARPLPSLEAPYKAAEELILNRRCQSVGVDYTWSLPLEYPLLHYLRTHLPNVRFYHPTLDPSDERPYFGDACAIVCLDCANVPVKDKRYRRFTKEAMPPIAVYWGSGGT